MRFEWDLRKDRSNRAKHGVGFQVAEEVFEDPFVVSSVDESSGTEERWLTLGMVSGRTLFVVIHTMADIDGEMVIRIISVRKATRHERTRYERGT